ncbi:MAG: hypothetical protein JSV99_06455 [Planctomycetota bacterium]|nr:MAG: hypothetical protein JSV99_06455 [Planctomycetota bacterium]
MKRVIANKADIIKWLTQFCVSSLFVTLAGKFFVGGGTAGMIFRDLFLYCSLAIAVGVILGDLSLYKGKKFIVSAVPVAIGSAFMGVFLWLLFVDSLRQLHVGYFIEMVFFWAVTTAPSIICYNAMTRLMRRKYWL